MPDPIRPGLGPFTPDNNARSLLGQLVGPDAQAQAAERERARRAAEVAANRRAMESLRRGEATTAGLAQGMRGRGELETVGARAARDDATIPGTGVTYNPTAVVGNAAEVVTAGHSDELRGAAGALRGRDYTESRDAARRQMADMRQRNPGSSAIGTALGIPLAAAMTPIVPTAGLSATGRLGAMALEGGILGGINASGRSEAELGSAQRNRDGFEGILGGGAGGLGLGLLGRGAQQVQQAQQARSYRDAERGIVAAREGERATARRMVDDDDPTWALETGTEQGPLADVARSVRDSRIDRMGAESRAARLREGAEHADAQGALVAARRDASQLDGTDVGGLDRTRPQRPVSANDPAARIAAAQDRLNAARLRPWEAELLNNAGDANLTSALNAIRTPQAPRTGRQVPAPSAEETDSARRLIEELLPEVRPMPEDTLRRVLGGGR
jgi:hypothetical protein